MASESENRVKKTFKIEYFIDRENELFAYICFVRKHIELGSKIPNRVINKIESIFDEANSLQDFRKDLIIDDVYKRFNNKYYHFRYKIKLFNEEDIPNEDGSQDSEILIETYDLKSLITQVVNDTYFQYSNNQKPIKDDCITNIFDCVEKYCKDNLNKKNYNFLKPYKKQAIAGFIATQYGFHLTEDRNPTNYQLFQATRNAIKKRGKTYS
ncbi:MAG: hypothetical protein IT232_06200 [Flavobacteriales bacterium]|nr:hypothetical protein [Flavobacteriales bacterium]